jgi:hypothetical protein
MFLVNNSTSMWSILLTCVMFGSKTFVFAWIRSNKNQIADIFAVRASSSRPLDEDVSNRVAKEIEKCSRNNSIRPSLKSRNDWRPRVKVELL